MEIRIMNKCKETIEKLKNLLNESKSKGHIVVRVEDIENTFLELKESEDERIRKDIIKFLIDVNNGAYTKSELEIASWIAWLEKQGVKEIKEEKVDNANKVEHKFKVGDWVVYNRNDHSREILQIYDIRDNRYYFNDNIHFSWSVKECDEKSHLWTIQDAKNGDVLASELCGTIMLYKGIRDNNIQFYCDYDFSDIDVPGDRFAINNGQHYGSVDDSDDWHPATKEQRDLLFKKMYEARCEWDADKKELKKIIDEKQIKKNLQDNSFRRMFEQESTEWSENIL